MLGAQPVIYEFLCELFSLQMYVWKGSFGRSITQSAPLSMLVRLELCVIELMPQKLETTEHRFRKLKISGANT